MSKTIDQRVVEMRFDNANFEKNVSTSMSTLDKLKKSLKFEDSAKGFENISKAAGRVDMGGLSNGVESVRLKFSALEVMAVTALQNITNSSVNAGKKLVSDLALDRVLRSMKLRSMPRRRFWQTLRKRAPILMMSIAHWMNLISTRT